MGSEREKAAAAGQRHTLDSIGEGTFLFRKMRLRAIFHSQGGCWILEGGATENNRSRS